MALAAQGVGTGYAEIGIGEEVLDQAAGGDCLAEFITAFEDVGPAGAMRAVRTCAAEFAIVVAVVAVGAEDLRAHGAALGDAIEVEHVGQQAD